MTELTYKRKFVSIEPIMDFDPDAFVGMIENIAPEHVSVGYGNWNNLLPEPSLLKTTRFIDRLNEFTKVRPRTLRRAWSH